MADLVGDNDDNVLVLGGGGGPNRINGMGGNDAMFGSAGDDTFDGDFGTLTGSASGIDVMQGGAGDDTYHVDNAGDQVVEQTAGAPGGNDTIIAIVDYTLSTNVENLTLGAAGNNATGNGEINIITGNTLDNTLDGQGGADTLDGGVGGGGTDTFVLDDAGDVILNTTADDNIINNAVISSVTFSANGGVGGALDNIQNITLVGNAAVNATGNVLENTITGNSAANVIDASGGAESDTIDGGGGADNMTGGDGGDTYFVDNVGDRVNEVALGGSDFIRSTITVDLDRPGGFYSNVENLTLIGTANINGTASATGSAITGNSGRNVITGRGGNDILSGGLNTGTAGDTLVGGAGDDTFIVYNAADVVRENAAGGTDTIALFTSFSLSAAALAGQEIENLTLLGTAVSGTGNTLDNLIVGNSLNNTLDGRAGTDTLVGGDGDDIFIVDTLADFVDEILDQGTDTVQFTGTNGQLYALTTFVENLVLGGTANTDGTGNLYDNTITGNAGNNVLDGNVGADTLIGGTGSDTYVVDDVNDVVTEAFSAGTDIVQADVTYTLGDNVEHLELTGALDTDGTGNALANSITGNTGINTLDGGGGNDRLAGGLNDDTYILDSAGDVIVENAGEGNDTVFSSVSVDLSAGPLFGAEIENITLTGTQANYVIGDANVNVITGNVAGNTLNGGAGADTLVGDAGDDTYVVDDAGDVIIEGPALGTDTVQSSISYDISLVVDLENITLTGVAAVDAIGNTGDNTLIGNSAVNALTGGDGDDVYEVTAGDTVNEAAGVGTGNDTIRTSASFDLSLNGVNVENLTLLGAAAISGTGDANANTIDGSTSSGANVLTGGAGDDTYYVGAGDTVVELVGEGTDTVVSSVNVVLNPANFIENLTLTGAAVSGTGDNSANVITGNAVANTLTGLGGNDTIDGGTGNDRMVGGLGDDLFIVDATGDTITEAAGEGVDTVQSSAASYTLAANVDNLTLTGTGNINGTGNADSNVIFGNAGNNSIDGMAGVDFLIGGDGDDTYAVDNAGDTVTEIAAQGTDTVRASITYTIAALANIENVVLTGTAAINATGNAGNNTLVGNSGVNIMTGGAGDDTYIVNSNDTVVELVGGGTDTLIVTITSGTYTVPANFENIQLIGTGNVGLTGDATSNTLSGNNGNNTLDGAGGADFLSGGKGQDVYIVDDTLDTVIELNGEGTDTVRASATFTLGANVENLVLTGAGNIDGFGNNQDNTITGNAGNNTLDGGTGTDKLYGGLGNDAYVVDTLRDVITDTGGNDSVITGLTYTLKIGLENLDLTGTDDIDATGNNSVNILVGNDGANILTGSGGNDVLYGGGDLLTGNVVAIGASTGDDILIGGIGADTMIGGDGGDTYFVDNLGDLVTELTGEGDDAVFLSISWVADPTAEIEAFEIGGTSAWSLTATDTDNVILGNSSNNRIFALDGADTIAGEGGNDTIDGGAGDDTITGGDGVNILTGGLGADLFDISTLGVNLVDTITDFTVADGDILDIADLLSGYDPLTDTLSDFVQIIDSGPNSIVRIDADGTANGTLFTNIVLLTGVTGLTGEAALVASGNLVVS